PDPVSCISQKDPLYRSKSGTITTVVLGTALVKLTTSNGNIKVFRALLDPGSMLYSISQIASQLFSTSCLLSLTARPVSFTLQAGLSPALRF
ncbi:hypothetical protein J6590_096491, partial [Homalodisca vitripennis]